mmetsp:Transcript_34607/g.89732  ORF Transcript_34607/g.89732 Transcript_34607/m.89732 type:complete len:158 (-) Transcript_34607:332-805(-)
MEYEEKKRSSYAGKCTQRTLRGFPFCFSLLLEKKRGTHTHKKRFDNEAVVSPPVSPSFFLFTLPLGLPLFFSNPKYREWNEGVKNTTTKERTKSSKDRNDFFLLSVEPGWVSDSFVGMGWEEGTVASTSGMTGSSCIERSEAAGLPREGDASLSLLM